MIKIGTGSKNWYRVLNCELKNIRQQCSAQKSISALHLAIAIKRPGRNQADTRYSKDRGDESYSLLRRLDKGMRVPKKIIPPQMEIEPQ